jgi:hypothetical protein
MCMTVLPFFSFPLFDPFGRKRAEGLAGEKKRSGRRDESHEGTGMQRWEAGYKTLALYHYLYMYLFFFFVILPFPLSLCASKGTEWKGKGKGEERRREEKYKS